MKTLIKYILLLLFILFIGTACGKDIQSDNLVQNPSFEDTDDEGNILYWENSSWIKTPESREFTISEQASSENYSAQIINFEDNHSTYSQIIPIKENAQYTITAMIKTENISTKAVGASLFISGLTSALGDVRQSQDWKEYGLNLITGSGIHNIELNLSLGFYGSLNTGTAWFDQISVTEVSGFTNNLPIKMLDKKALLKSDETLSIQEKQLEDKIKDSLDIFSIFAGIILFLGTAFYMVFVIHEDKDHVYKKKDKSINDGLEKAK